MLVKCYIGTVGILEPANYSKSKSHFSNACLLPVRPVYYSILPPLSMFCGHDEDFGFSLLRSQWIWEFFAGPGKEGVGVAGGRVS